VPIDTRLRRTLRSVKRAIAAVKIPEKEIMFGHEKKKCDTRNAQLIF